MRWFAVGVPAVAAVTALLIVLLINREPDPLSSLPPGLESEDDVNWLDPVAARFGRELDARREAILERSQSKSQIALSLARGEITLDEAANRFQSLNGPGADGLTPLRRLYPNSTNVELVYRQVLLFVRGNHRQDPERVSACLPALEAEVHRRFHADRAIHANPGPANNAAPAMGHVTAQAARDR
jgi:hypothetical protein